MVIKLPPIDNRKKTCPSGQHLENGVCVPDVKPEKEKLPVADGKETPIEEEFIEREGKFFKVGAREKAELMRRGKLTQEEAFPVQAARTEELAQQVGQVPEVGEIPMLPTDIISLEQAAKSALALTLAGVAGGAAVGAVGGAPIGGVGAVPGAIIGAIVGGLSTFIGGFRANLESQRKDMQAGESANLRKQEQNMLKIVMNVNRGGDPVQSLGFFNSQMSLIDENYARLKMKTSDDLSLWLGLDGHPQMERYEVFYSAGGMHDILTAQMQEAILNPDPNRILIGLADIEEE